MKNKFVLWGNGPCTNRGCEAILRSTIEILNSEYGDVNYLSCHGSRSKPNDCDLVRLPKLKHRSVINRKYSLPFFFRSYERLSGKVFRFESHLRNAIAVLGLGGDNFSNDYHKLPFKYFSSIERAFSKKVPFIVWGVSTGFFESDFEGYAIKTLKKAKLISVRESLSYNYLCYKGLKNLKLVSDPAFVMQISKPKLTDEFIGFISGGNVVGINFSPLYGKFYCGGKEGWGNLCKDMILKIMDKYDMKILLIPHVFNDGNNDEDFMRDLLEQIPDRFKDRIVLLAGSSLNAMEIKWVIGKMRYFIGSRTHATIAAFSQSIPTISLGYSVKAKGINQDIFGHQNWVLSSEDVSCESFITKFNELINEEDCISKRYNSVMPDYISKAWAAGKYVKIALEDEN